MPKPIDLTEIAPGEWRFVRLIRLAMGKHLKGDAAARRERFFDSLSGQAIKTKPDEWWTGGVAILLIIAPMCVFLAFCGRWDIVFMPVVLVGVFAIYLIVISLCMGATWSEALRSIFRP